MNDHHHHRNDNPRGVGGASASALADRLIMSGLLGGIGLALGWVLGCAAIIVYSHARVPILRSAAGWAWNALRGGEWVLRTSPPWIGHALVGGAVLLAIAGVAVGWMVESRPAETHRRGYRVDTDARGISVALRGAGEKADGVYLHPTARISLSQECRHMMILGGAGSGKTTILTPVIQQAIDRGDRVLIFDYKSDFSQIFPSATLLAPWDERSWAWQLGADIRTRLDAEALAATLVPAPDRGEQIWAHGAQGLLTALIARIQRKHGTRWGYGALARTAAAALADYPYLSSVVSQEAPQAKAFLAGADSKMTASFLAEMASSLSHVISLGVAEHALHQTAGRWSVQGWLAGETPRAAILGYLSSAPDLSRAWSASIIDRAVRTLADLPDHDAAGRRVWLFLDEIPQAGKVPSITDAIVTLRSKAVRIVVGAQSIAQIRETYSRETATIWASSTAAKIIAQTTAPEDQRWASDLLGERELDRYHRQVSRALGGGATHTESWAPTRERVMMPSDFARLLHVTPRGPRALIIAGGAAAILRWPWPAIPKTGAARIPARWLSPEFARPVWGKVPPEITAPPEPDDTPGTPVRPARDERVSPALAPLDRERRQGRRAAGPPPPQAQQPRAQQNAAARGREDGDPARDAVVDRLASVALDAVLPGVGAVLDLTQTVADAAHPAPAPAAAGVAARAEFPLECVEECVDRDSEDEVER